MPKRKTIQPVVGVFDLGTRAFEGIRNASRMDDDDDGDDDHDGGGMGSSGSGRNVERQQQASSSSAASSPRPSLGAIQEGSAGWDGGGGRGAAAAVGLLSLRARPPRMFGPLGEMDAFTWETAVAQAVLRAGMRDEGDFPSERYEMKYNC